MLKQGSFINKKINIFILGNIWGFLAYCINLMTDSLISGNQLGEVALQAVSIVFPLFSVIYFFAYLMPLGASVLFGKAIGEFKHDEANRTAGTCFISSIIIGILLAGGLWLIKDPFLAYFECTGELLEEASSYYNWIILFAVLQPICASLFYLCVTDGESVLLSAAKIPDVFANIILSVVLSRIYGIEGLSIATCIGSALGLVIFLGHFLKKSNNIKPLVCLDIRIIIKSIALSFSDYMYYLFLAVVDIVLNKIIIANCGIEYIPAYAVVNLVFGVGELFGSINYASMGFLTCFLGEKNNHDIKLVFRKITYAIIVMGVGIAVFFFFGAPLMPILYGLETEVTVSAAVFTSRIMSLTVLGFGACYLLGTVSNSVEKPAQSCFVVFLYCVFTPLLLSLLLGSLWGFNGIVVGMSFSPYLAFGLYAIIRIPRKGKTGFPVYVKDFGEEGISFDLYVTNEAIVELREWMHSNLEVRGFDYNKTDILIEEFYTRVMEKNPGKKVLSECTMIFGDDRVRIIIRDDGMLFNFVDENNRVESLNAHVLNSILEQTEQKNYLITTSFNRNGFIFEK